MSRNPWVVITILYIIGILIKIPHPYPFLLISIILFFYLYLIKHKASIIALYLSVIFFGSFSYKLHSYKGPFHIAHHINQRGDVIGTIINYPSRYKDRTSFVLKVESFNGKKSDGLISVTTKEPSLFLGNKLLISDVMIKEPRVYNNPERYNRKKALFTRKIYVSIWSDKVSILGKEKINPFLKIASNIKSHAERIVSLLPEEEKNFILGIALGERACISQEIYEAFKNTGTIHIISVSGLHLALLFGFFVMVFGLFGIKKPPKFTITIPILFLFSLITGSSVPTIRSLIMILIFIFSMCFEREPSIYNILSQAALIILILNPFQIYNIGFQLSFVACFSLAILTPKFIFRKDKLSLFLSSCISCSIGIAPIVLFYFSKVSLISPISNLFIIPLIGILLPLSLIFILIGFISIHLASLLILPLSLLTKIIISLILAFSSIKGSSITLPSPCIPIIIFLYLFIIIFVFRIKGLFCPFLLILNIILFYNVLKPKGWEVVFLNVGAGDCVFITSPLKSHILIDGGAPFAARSCVLPFLQYKGIDRIDILIATHQDADHIGGLADIIKALNIKRVFYNGFDAPTLVYKEFKRATMEKGLCLERLKMGDRIKGIDFNIEVLNPPFVPIFPDDNNNSIVLKLNFKNLSFLLPSDIGNDSISVISNIYKGRLNATILKAPHHGRHNIPEDFVALVKPKFIIASGFKLPSRNIISTEDYGAITIKGHKNGYKVETYVNKDKL